jgi:hypothetical protein
MTGIQWYVFLNCFLFQPYYMLHFAEHWHGGGVQHTLIEGGSLVNNADNSTSGDGTS